MSNASALKEVSHFLGLLGIDGINRIEIPIIQRDYAQGRKSANEKRSEFLNAIFTHLSGDKALNIDFVYGTIENGRFIPLDGQQRLTTLFLLHCYAALVTDKRQEFKKYFIIDNKSKFGYENRASAREFCDALAITVAEESSLEFDVDHPSEVIKNRPWYFSLWDRDPTIQGMLVMMDAIHEKYAEQPIDNFFDALNKITFRFVDLKAFKLTDELYIRMNARGKQLTDFEHFKAMLEDWIDKHIKNISRKYILGSQEVSIKKYFAHRIDNAWTDLFWSYHRGDSPSNLAAFDNKIMHFVRAIAANYYASKTPEKQDGFDEIMRLLIDGKEYISFYWYNDHKIIDKDFILQVIDGCDLMAGTTGIQDAVSPRSIQKYLPDNYYYFDEENIFKEIIKPPSPKYTVRLQWFAYYRYLTKHKQEDGSVDCTGLENWMRIIHNLTENTICDHPAEFHRFIKSIDYILQYSSNILQFFTDTKKMDDWKSRYFFPRQIEEERLKAHLIQRNSEWKDIVWEYERHPYFKGQVDFLLEFSGIYSYLGDAGLPSSSAWKEENACKQKLKDYYQKANAIFDKNGLRDEIRTDLFLWQRALLKKGDYLLSHSFLHDTKKDRDISWKRLLRGEEEDKRKFVQDIFIDEQFDYLNLEKSLERIIKKDQEKITDWRLHFIKDPTIIRSFSRPGAKRIYRWDRFYLLRTNKNFGGRRYAEYYSYALFCSIGTLSENTDDCGELSPAYQPLQKMHYIREGDPHLFLPFELGNNKYGIDVYYYYHMNDGNEPFVCKIHFFVRKDNDVHALVEDKKICDILADRKYERKSNGDDNKDYIYTLSISPSINEGTEQALELVKSELKLLCEAIRG